MLMLAVGSSALINLLFVILIAALVCYAIGRLVSEPIRTVGYVLVALILLLWVWRSGLVS